MKSSGSDYSTIGPRLTLTFAALIALILGGNGLVVWQFNIARTQTDRLSGANQQMNVVLQLQVNLLAFHQRLDDLARSRDAHRLAAEKDLLRRALLTQTQQTRTALANLPPETSVDPAFWPTLETIEVSLPPQLTSLTELANSGDWEAVQLRLGRQLKPIETQTAILVASVDQRVRRELTEAAVKMRTVQRRILFIVPATAISTFLVAAFFGWSLARRIIELRLHERVTERMRIAGELHDTLLQTIQASRMVAGASLDKPADATEQRRALETVSTWLDQAVQEARAALNSLRAPASGRNDLKEAFQGVIEECRMTATAEISFSVVGGARDVHPVLRDEIFRIGFEALRNACAHARASHIDVQLRYAQDLALCIKDDGAGIEPAVIDQGRTGHFGLQGMRERAARIGGELTLTSSAASGTEIKLVVPGGTIFRTISPARPSLLGKFRKRALRVDSTSKFV